MKRCPFEAFGSIALITSMPHMKNCQGADRTFNVVGETLILSAYA